MSKVNSTSLEQELDPLRIPGHVAIILDGNGRWAKNKHLPRISGHAMGAKRVSEIVTAASDLGIQALSLYAFSTENWSRPEHEVSFLMSLLVKYLKKELKNLVRKDVKLVVSGHLEELPAAAKAVINQTMESSKQHRGMIFNLCLNYGGRRELTDACRALIKQVNTGQLSIAEIDEQLVGQYIYHPELGDIDLMIRTSGEERISNFLLWQLAYSELYFTPVMWPDFTKIDLLKAIIAYQKRERRFGGI
ncbi:MAG: isoprenyl transferase [bacterium]|nr:isoprenyl transferase [bacterium]MDD5756877.1 isoprenyl transferase [bacterium]